MSRLASLLSINTAEGPILVSTVEGVEDEIGTLYQEGLKDHPSISLRLSDALFGTVEIGDISAQLVTLGGLYVEMLRNNDIRDYSATLRVKNLDTDTIIRTLSGKVDQGSFDSNGTYNVTIVSNSRAVLEEVYPKLVISSALFGSERFNTLDLNLPIPIIFGATREKVPCRYVEEDQTNSRFRYVIGSDLSISADDEPLMVAYPNTVYQSLSGGVGIIPNRNYDIEISEKIEAPNALSSNGTSNGGLNGSVGTYAWVYTALNGLGETTPSAPFYQDTAFNGSTVGGQKLTWYPSATPKATGFRFYRSEDNGTTYELLQEVLDPKGHEYFDENDNPYCMIIDEGGATDPDFTPPTSNTTRGGISSVVFDRLQWGQSSQVVPLFADVECTEVSARTDSIGWWLFRDEDPRDLLRGDQPRLVSYKHQSYWDFRDKPVASGTYDASSKVFSPVVGRIEDRVGSNHFYTTGNFTSLDYEPGVAGYPAITNFASAKGLLMPSASAGPFQYGTTKSFRWEAIAKPNLGTGARTMIIAQRGYPIARSGNNIAWWKFGVSEGRAFAQVRGVSDADPFEVFGTTPLDGAYHKIAFEVTRAGTAQGTPPVESPKFYSSVAKTARNLNKISFYLDTLGSASNDLVFVSVHVRDSRSAYVPAQVKVNGVALNGPISSTSGTANPYLSTTVWDGINTASVPGTYLVEVTFSAGVLPQMVVCTAANLYNILQGSGTTYRDISGTNSSTGATSSTVTFTPDESQNKSYLIDAFTYDNQNLSTSYSLLKDQIVRREAHVLSQISPTKFLGVRGVISTRPENGSGAQSMGWTLSASKQLAHVAVAYNPLGSATSTDTDHDYLTIEVDGVEEGRVVVDDLGDMSTHYVSAVDLEGLYVGAAETTAECWDGNIDSLESFVDATGAAIGPAFNFTYGKSGASSNAIVCASGLQLPYCSSSHDADVYDMETSDFTIECFVKFTQLGSNQTICAKHNGFTGYVLGVNGNGTPYFTLYVSGRQYDAVGTESVQVGRWRRIEVVVLRETPSSAGYVQLRVDGVNVGTQVPILAATTVSVTSTSSFGIGHHAYNGGRYNPAYCIIDELHIFLGIRTEEESMKLWGLGMRNVVSQIQAFLESGSHGPGETVDPVSFQAAREAIRDLAYDGSDPATRNLFVTDFAVVEQAPLRDHFSEMLRVRGMSLGTDTQGQWTITVDEERSPEVAFGFGDGALENIVDRPTWKKTPVREAIKRLWVQYRLRRNGTGGVDGFSMQTPKRDVLTTLGTSTPVQVRAIRDRETADRYADYITKRTIAGDELCSFQAGEEAEELSIGDLITITDGTTNVTDHIHEIVEIQLNGNQVSLSTRGWDADVYTYTEKPMPQDIYPENEPSLDAINPLPPTEVALTITQDIVEKTSAKFSVTWTPPVVNYSGVKILYRRTDLDGESFIEPWRTGVELDRNSGGRGEFGVTVELTTPYVVAVQSRSPSGLYSVFARSAIVTTTA